MQFGKVGAAGTRLHYAEQGSPAGIPVVFLHGWPDSWFSYSRVLSLLPDRFRAFALDQRGFGDSDRPGCCYRIADFADDVARFLDAVEVERAVVVGHSFGTFVARAAALAHPDRVAGLVLVGTGVSPANPVTRAVQADVSRLPDPIPPEFARDFQASTAYLPLPERFFEQLVTESLKLPARLWREVVDRMLEYDDAEALRRLTVPTLLVWGEKDALFPREDQFSLLAALPNARLEIYPETGHCPNWERPERLVEDLSAFILESAGV